MTEYVDEVPPEDPYQVGPVKVDPHRLIERQVIGAVVKSPRALAAVRREISGGDFDDPHLADIFNGIIRMSDQGAPVDYLTVADALPEWDVRSPYGVTDLSAWSDSAPGPESAVYYAGLVREASMRRLMSSVGSRLLTPGAEVGVELARAQEDLRRISDMTVQAGPRVRWLRDVLSAPESEDAYDWVVPDMLERRDRLMLSAAEGSGKSTLLRQVVVLAAAGIHPLRFSPIDPVRVLVVDAENSEKQWRRASRRLVSEATLRGRCDPSGHVALHCVAPMDLAKPKDIGQVHSWMDQSRPDLVLLGPLYRMTSGGLNEETEVAHVLNALDTIRERDVTMLIEVHAGHARSTSGERELRPRGSSALLGWPEFGLGLRRDKTIEGRVRTYSLVRWRGDRDARVWPKLTRGQVWPWEPAGGF